MENVHEIGVRNEKLSELLAWSWIIYFTFRNIPEIIWERPMTSLSRAIGMGRSSCPSPAPLQEYRLLMRLALCCALAAGCDRKPQLAVVRQPAQPDAPVTVPQTMDIRPLSQLIPDRPTHLAADDLGNVYWVQETPEGEDILFVAGQDESPHPTGLTAGAIVAVFGPPPAPTSRPGASTAAPATASGNIESIAVDSDNRVLFFFSGGIGRSTRICLGRFNPLDQSIQILAGTQALAEAGRMGASIQVAQGQIIKPFAQPSDRPMRYWLWLHHSDTAVFLQFDPRAAEPGQPIELTRAFEQLSGKELPPSLASDSLQFSAGSDAPLWMVDWHAARLWRLDETGAATPWTTLMGLPRELSDLMPQPGGIAIAFAPVGDPAVGTEGDGQLVTDAHILPVQCPILLAIQQDRIIPVVTSDNIQGSRFDVAKLKLRSLVPTSTPRRWIAYDATSGILMRIRLTPKN
jgi:hypothetical protein